MSGERGVTRPRPLPELLLVAGMFAAYKLGRLAISGHLSEAYANAERLWHLERTLRLPSEAALQQAALGWPWLIHAADLFYASVHFPATAALLLWTYWRRPSLYRWTRTTLALLTLAAFVLHWLVPLAPPRLLASSGMIDTGRLMGPSVYGDPAYDSLSNQFAAMPSLHVGWAAAVAVTLVLALNSQWRWLWFAYPAVTLAVVVVTANHYWLDAAVAVAMLGVIVAVLPRRRRRRPESSPQTIGQPRTEPVSVGRQQPGHLGLQLAGVVAVRTVDLPPDPDAPVAVSVAPSGDSVVGGAELRIESTVDSHGGSTRR
jgi:hypothetical protein